MSHAKHRYHIAVMVLMAGLLIATGGGMFWHRNASANVTPTTPFISTAQNTNIVFPADAGVINVTEAPYNAVPSDGIDDTAAIQAALDDHPSGNHVFYFPNGVYDLSNTLIPALDDGVTKRNILQGQSETGVVLKLRDGLNFTSAVVNFRSGPAQFFRNAVRNLTIDIGSGNPGAVGLNFNASNQGVISTVTIRSGDGQGAVGLELTAGEPGPLLVHNVTVDGFDIGVLTQQPTASQTFEGLTLRNQNIAGWQNTRSQNVFARGVNSQNAVTAIQNTGEGRMLVVDSELTGLSGADSETAVRNQKAIYLRNVTVSGYANAVNNELRNFRGNQGLVTGHITEYWANGAFDNRRGGPFELFESPDAMLGLPVAAIPEVPWDQLADWAGPQQFGGVAGDGADDTAALQAAIDSGATTVYLPRGDWQLDGVVELRNNVRRFLGAEARILGSGTIRLVDGTVPVVVLERLEKPNITLEHASGRTWVLNNLLGLGYIPAANQPGDVFINDVVGDPVTFRNQQVWARQLNLESDADAMDPAKPDAKIVNDGATVWILGFKTEGRGTWVRTINGGKTEMLGGLKVGGGGVSMGVENAMFVTENAALSAAITRFAATNPPPDGHEFLAKETRGNDTRTATGFANADIYTAFDINAIANRAVQIDAGDSVGVTIEGTWMSSTGFPGGFIDSDFLYASGTGNRVTFTPNLPQSGEYEVWARWVSDRSGQDHAGHASNATFIVTHAGGPTQVTVDQRDDGGRWVSIGSYTFDTSTVSSVSLASDGANGKVLADAVQFVRAAP